MWCGNSAPGHRVWSHPRPVIQVPAGSSAAAAVTVALSQLDSYLGSMDNYFLYERTDGRYEILKAYRAHLGALARHQDPNGMWHQVIDRPESYREMTSTCSVPMAAWRG